jgi:hypothetical protein
LYPNSEYWYGVNCKVESSEYDNQGMKEIVEWAISQPRSNDILPRLLQFHKSVVFQVALSLLCQGNLGRHVLTNHNAVGGIDTTGSPDLGKALKAMGWVEDETTMKVSQLVVDLNLSAKQLEPDISFWTDPFVGLNSLRGGIQSELPRSLLKLPGICNLLNTIEQNKVNTKGFKDTVTRAYLELNILLETA